jgi:hypothetical protein
MEPDDMARFSKAVDSAIERAAKTHGLDLKNRSYGGRPAHEGRPLEHVLSQLKCLELSSSGG